MSGIKRYFSSEVFKIVSSELGFLIDAVNKSQGELDFQIRPDNKINIYYKGNSLAEISIRRDFYKIKVHHKFCLKEALMKDPSKRFDQYSLESKNGYDSVSVARNLIHPCLQKKVLNSLMSKIKEVNNGEEINFEQSLMTDNLNRTDYIIIDRQVGGGGMPGMLDLLALREVSPGKYQLEAIEVKLGNNKELKKDVYSQLDRYVKAISSNHKSFKLCYEKNYEQKKALGLFEESCLESIEISGNVSGKIVVGSYCQIGLKYRSELRSNYPDSLYDVQLFENLIE